MRQPVILVALLTSSFYMTALFLISPLCMRAASRDVQKAPASSPPQPASAITAVSTAAPPSTMTDIDNAKPLTTDNTAEAQEEKPEPETGPTSRATPPPPQTQEHAPEMAMPSPTVAEPDVDAFMPELFDNPEQETIPTWPATPPPQTPEHATGMAAPAPGVVEPDVETVKPDNENPPPPAHDSEGSDTQTADDLHGVPQNEKRKLDVSDKRDVAASTSRLLAFRSFARDRKSKGWGDAASQGARPAQGKAGEDKDHQEKSKERRKRCWK